MSRERLNSNDKKILLIWILAGLLGAGVGYKYFFRAFPEASVEFKVSRAAALELARQFAISQSANLEGSQSSIVFDVDETAKTYLEREVGLAQANQYMAGDTHVWFWQTRFFRPLSKEEFDVRVNPSGAPADGQAGASGSAIVGYSHVLEETAPGARLERPAAQATAEAFLRDSLHLDLSRYDFRDQEAGFTERPNRRDWSFSWERSNFRAKDAPYRLKVTLAGNRVSAYEEHLQVPEAWKNGYERLRSSNNLLEFIALIPYAFVFGGCLQIIFSLGRRGLLEWRGSLALGIFLAALYFVMTINNWPLDRAGYDTNTPYSTYFLSKIGQAALVSILSSLVVVLAVAPGEPLYRASQPDKLRLWAPLRLPGIQTREFFRAAVIGVCLAAVHIGYITVFYIVSGKLGAWAPQDVKYTNVLSTSLPWVYPLAIGIYAATSEEFLFRLFAIPFLQRLTRSKVLAVVLPAIAWGFLHSNYPQQPPYIRGIEVGLIGIVAGIVMLRWGIWATLTWHYTVDAFLISTSLMRSSGAYLQISGMLVGGAALIPIAIAGILYLKRGGFATDPSLLNSAVPLSSPQDLASDRTVVTEAAQIAAMPQAESIFTSQDNDTRAAVSRYSAMSSRALMVLVVCGVIGLAVTAMGHREQIGDFVRFSTNASQATTIANQIMRDQKLDPDSYHQIPTVTYTFDGYTNEYLRRSIGIAAANAIYRDRVPSAFWTVRYFRDSQPEEYMVVLRTDGSLHSVHHTLAEQTPGANLSSQDAEALAESYLRDQKHLDLSAWKLVVANTDKQPARTDHTFEWEQKAALNSETSQQPGAHIRIESRVQGDEVSGYRTYVKIPETWTNTESRTTPLQIVQTFGSVVFGGAVVIIVLLTFFRSLKHPEIAQVPWRRLARWSAWLSLAAIVMFANRLPQLLDTYKTTSPLSIYYVTLAITIVFGIAIYLAGIFLLLGLACFFVARAFGREQFPGWLGMPKPYYRDAFCIAIFGSAAVIGLNRIPTLFAHWPVLRHSLGTAVPQGFDALNAATASIAAGFYISFLVVGVVALAAGLIATYVRSFALRVGLALLIACLMATNVATPGSFFLDSAFRFLIIIVLWTGVARLVRFNLMGYFLLAATVSLVAAAVELIEQPNSYLHFNGYAVLASACALLIWPLVSWLGGQPGTSSETAV